MFNMSKFILNPLIRIHIKSSHSIYLINGKNKKHYNITQNVPQYILLFDFLTDSKSSDKIIDFIIKKINETGLFEYLVENEIIIRDNNPIIENYKIPWSKYNWEDLFFFLKNTEENEYVDDVKTQKEKDKVREKIYDTFLKEAPLKSYVSTKNINVHIDLKKISEIVIKQDFFKSVFNRRTIRNFSEDSISIEELAYILKSSTEAMRKRRKYVSRNIKDNLWLFSHSHSLWFKILIVVHNVEGIDSGLYEYDYVSQVIRRLNEKILDYDAIQKVVIGQNFMINAAVSFFIVADFQNIFWRYRYSGSYKTVLTTVGELAQKIIVSSNTVGLGAFETPAIIDENQEELLGTTPFVQEALYYVAIGRHA